MVFRISCSENAQKIELVLGLFETLQPVRVQLK